MITATRVQEIALTDIDRTYRGDVGCACGCGGDYFDVTNDEHIAEIKKHLKYINQRLKDALPFGSGIEVTNPAYTKATRVYLKEGTVIYKDGWNNLIRITEKAGE